MSRVGITGHQQLFSEQPREAASAWQWVRESLLNALSAVEPPLIGLSSLAAGADQVFAEVVLECRGKLEVILPFAHYESLLSVRDRQRFEALQQGAQVKELLARDPIDETARAAAFIRAGEYVVDHSERLFAVLEGREKSTSERIVTYARERGRPVTIFDPRRRVVLSGS